MSDQDHSVLEIATGAAVLAAAVGFFAYMTADGFEVGTNDYELKAEFNSAEGVGIGTEVRLAGVQIGSVVDMQLNPSTFLADLTLSIDDAYQLPDDSAVAIASESLLGGSFVEIIPGGSPFDLEAGDTFLDAQSSVSLLTLLLRFVGGSGE